MVVRERLVKCRRKQIPQINSTAIRRGVYLAVHGPRAHRAHSGGPAARLGRPARHDVASIAARRVLPRPCRLPALMLLQTTPTAALGRAVLGRCGFTGLEREQKNIKNTYFLCRYFWNVHTKEVMKMLIPNKNCICGRSAEIELKMRKKKWLMSIYLSKSKTTSYLNPPLILF